MLIRRMNNVGLVVTRGKDNAIYKESTLMYYIAKALSEYGEDVIRKEMCKDGHLVNNGVYYVVDRKRRYCYYDDDYAVRDICKDYNDGNPVSLCFMHLDKTTC